RSLQCTLFPYTTLFRSNGAREAAAVVKPDPDEAEVPILRPVTSSPSCELGRSDRFVFSAAVTPIPPTTSGRPQTHREGGPTPEPDRKSTRLNSSHVSIS